MKRVELASAKKQIIFGNDSKVIEKYISGNPKGGASLDCTGYTDEYIYAGHVIINDGTNYLPMPVTGEGDAKKYAALPEGSTYAGILYRTIETKKPFASIMTNGEVNSVCVPFAMDEIMAAFKAACPLIVFVKDEEPVA